MIQRIVGTLGCIITIISYVNIGSEVIPDINPQHQLLALNQPQQEAEQVIEASQEQQCTDPNQ